MTPGSTTGLTGVVIHGAAVRPGRLHAAASSFVALLAELGVVTELIDLGHQKLPLADGTPVESMDDDSRKLLESVGAADAVAICSPVYRASFPGSLKNLLDLLPVDSLRNKPVAIVAMGAAAEHYLAVETQLRAILAWFGSWTLPTAVYLTGRDFDSDGQPVDRARHEIGELGRLLADATKRLAGSSRGPLPLAART